MDFKITSGYFIGYLEKSKGYRFYSSTYSTRIIESENVRFIKNGETSGSEQRRNVVIEEVGVEILLPITSKVIPTIAVQPNNVQEQLFNDQPLHNEVVTDEAIVVEPQVVVLRKSQREKWSAILDDYMVYLQESKFDLGINNVLSSFSQAIESIDSAK